MEIIRHSGATFFKTFVEKSIGNIGFCANVPFESMTTEKIRLFVERNGYDNYEITKNEVSLRALILAMTAGTDAITSFPAAVGEAFDTVALLELVEGGNLNLASNEKLRIEMSGLDATKLYVLFGLEEYVDVKVEHAFQFEEKQMLADTKDIKFNTEDFDVVIIDDDPNINVIQFEGANGRTIERTRQEVRIEAQDLDQICYVKKDGKVITGFPSFLQLPLVNIRSITVKKNSGSLVNLLFRKDNTPDVNGQDQY